MMLMAVLDIEADRRKVRLVHPRVHRKGQGLPARRDLCRQPVEAAERLAPHVAPEQPQFVLRGIEGTDNRVNIIDFFATSEGFSLREQQQEKENRRNPLELMLRKAQFAPQG